jgi:hypothetical protein
MLSMQPKSKGVTRKSAAPIALSAKTRIAEAAPQVRGGYKTESATLNYSNSNEHTTD